MPMMMAMKRGTIYIAESAINETLSHYGADVELMLVFPVFTSYWSCRSMIIPAIRTVCISSQMCCDPIIIRRYYGYPFSGNTQIAQLRRVF